jgi:hypothetical protein
LTDLDKLLKSTRSKRTITLKLSNKAHASFEMLTETHQRQFSRTLSSFLTSRGWTAVSSTAGNEPLRLSPKEIGFSTLTLQKTGQPTTSFDATDITRKVKVIPHRRSGKWYSLKTGKQFRTVLRQTPQQIEVVDIVPRARIDRLFKS